MIAELLNLVIIGGLAGLSLAGLLAGRLRRNLRAIEDCNRQLYQQLAPQTEADFLAQLRNDTLIPTPPAMW
jgi:hypothetical protein